MNVYSENGVNGNGHDFEFIFQSPKKNFKNFSTWRELTENQNYFLHLLKLLLKHEEIDKKNVLTPLFYLRKAISIARTEDVRIFIRDLGGYLYHIVSQLEIESGSMCTAWLHEDGIQTERDEYYSDHNHPAHQLICLTDLFQKNSKVINLVKDLKIPSDATMNLMMMEVN